MTNLRAMLKHKELDGPIVYAFLDNFVLDEVQEVDFIDQED